MTATGPQTADSTQPGTGASYDAGVHLVDSYLARSNWCKLVLHDEDRPWENTRQGRIKYYLFCTITPDTALQDFKVFVHDIRRHSGRHSHQGGVIIYVLEGRGWSVVDGERVDWETGDMLILPLKPGGVEHQHFNAAADQGCRWLAMRWFPFQLHLASETVQREEVVSYRD